MRFTGLFHKAICQSGVMSNPWALTERSVSINNGLQLAEKLGKATSDTEVAYKFLKETDARRLKEAEIELFSTKTVNVTMLYYNYCNNNSMNYTRKNKIISHWQYIFLQNRLQIVVAFTPTVDSESSNPLLPVEPLKLLHNGIKMPLIFGYTSCEGIFFLRGKFFGCKYIFAFTFHHIYVSIVSTHKFPSGKNKTCECHAAEKYAPSTIKKMM